MIVGTVKKIKDKENRVGLTPSGVATLVTAGHTVWVERSAGLGSAFSDEEYVKAGARIALDAASVWKTADMVVKVKEPLPPEFPMMREGQILFTYLHLAAAREAASALHNSKTTGVAYETVTVNGRLPLLAPMSEVAGRMSVLIGAYYLAKFAGGRGVLLPGVTNAPPGHVVVLGGGFAGTNAAQMAYGLGAKLTIVEKNPNRIKELQLLFPKAEILESTTRNIEAAVSDADVLVGAVLVPGASAPKLVTRQMISSMKKGAVFVDISIDQGGCSETSKPTSHSNPVYDVDGVTHYCVTNMPGAVSRTSTIALTTATLPFALEIANGGLDALRSNPSLREGVNTFAGNITNKPVAEALGVPFVPFA